jgi:RNA-binding protein 39
MLEREIEQQSNFLTIERLLEDSKRDDATVLILQLPPAADENDIYQYFKNGNCGKVSDIRIIKDARSGKSKGIAYVEFYLQDSILKAISMTNGFIKG